MACALNPTNSKCGRTAVRPYIVRRNPSDRSLPASNQPARNGSMMYGRRPACRYGSGTTTNGLSAMRRSCAICVIIFLRIRSGGRERVGKLIELKFVGATHASPAFDLKRPVMGAVPVRSVALTIGR